MRSENKEMIAYYSFYKGKKIQLILINLEVGIALVYTVSRLT